MQKGEKDLITPLASIIIPAYNAERFLDATIQSALIQEYQPIEIIVVDDGSSDQTGSIAKKYDDVCYIYQENQGQAAAMNTGIKVSRGEFISFLDSDDLLLPEKLSKHIDFLSRHQEIDMIMSLAKNFKDPSFDSDRTLNIKIDESEKQLFSTATIRKSVFEKVGVFDISHKNAKEIDWLFRAKENGIIIEKNKSIVLLRRLHDANMSYNIKAKSSDFMNVVRSSIARKKAQRST